MGWSFVHPQITGVQWSCAFTHCSHFFRSKKYSCFYCIIHIFSAAKNIALFTALLLFLLRRKIELFFAYYSYLLHNVRRSSWLCYIAFIFLTAKAGALRFFELLGSFSRIVWFFFHIFCLGWEIFYEIDCLVFFLHLLFGLRGFLS